MGLNGICLMFVLMIAVYIIRTHFGTYYTGMTNSLIRRWGQHIGGKSSYLRRVRPREVVHVEFYPNYSKASKKERYIKSVGARKYLLKLMFDGVPVCIDSRRL